MKKVLKSIILIPVLALAVLFLLFALVVGKSVSIIEKKTRDYSDDE